MFSISRNMKQMLGLTIFLALALYGVDSIKNPMFSFFKNKAIDVIEKAGVNSECSSHLKQLITDLVKRKTWALQMLDSSAKVQTGLFSGNLNQYGSFDECLDIRHKEKDSEIIGQYCSVLLRPRANITSEYDVFFDVQKMSQQLGYSDLHLSVDYILNLAKVMYGICIPKSCTIGNLQQIWNYVEHTFALPFHATFTDFMCTYTGKIMLPFPMDTYSFIFFAMVLIVVGLSTFYDVLVHQHLKHEPGTEMNIWISFSIYTNFSKIFSFNSQTDSNMACLNGIKVLGMLTVILGHRTFVNMFDGNSNAFYVFRWGGELKSTFFQLGFYAVDSFFVMSGLLLSYGYAQYTEIMKRKISWIGFYFYRILRLSPALIAMVLFYISVLKHLNEGPVWPILAHKMSASCLGTWWATVFFFSNWLSFEHQCIEQSWYLAADTQLYIISPIVLISLYKSPKKTAIVCFFICVASSVYAFFITYVYKYGAIFSEGNRDFQRFIYQPSFIRMPSWMIGIFLGFLIHRHRKVTIPKGLNIFLWSFSASLLIYLILLFAYIGRTTYNPLRSAIFNALARPAWSLANAFIIFACITGNGGSINRFLSHPIFGVLAKLSYSVYLVHLVVIFVISGGSKSTTYFSTTKIVHNFIGDVLFVFIAGTIWCLVFESPFINIGKILYKRDIAESGKNKGTNLVPYKKLEIKKRVSQKKHKQK